MPRIPRPDAEVRTRDGSGWIVLPRSGRAGKPPSLSLAGRGLSSAGQKLARELWRSWWSSPVAFMWSPEADRYGLERLLVLTVRSRGGDATGTELSEIRQLEDRFGFSPQARRKLYWRIEGVDVPSTEAGDLSGATAGRDGSLPRPGGDSDPRRLRVVKSDD